MEQYEQWIVAHMWWAVAFVVFGLFVAKKIVTPSQYPEAKQPSGILTLIIGALAVWLIWKAFGN